MQQIDTIINKVERQLISAFALLDSWLDNERSIEPGFSTDLGSPYQPVVEQTLKSNESLLALVRKGRLFSSMFSGSEGTGGRHGVAEILTKINPAERLQRKQLSPADRLRRTFRDQLEECLYQVDLLQREGALPNASENPIGNLMELDVYQYLQFIAFQTRKSVMKLESLRMDSLSEDVSAG